MIEPANDNGAGQIVISGHRRRSSGRGPRRTKGVRRAMLLPVSAPFHCALMAPAADAMAEALESSRRAPDRAADRQCVRGEGNRPGRDPRPAGPSGHRYGSLAECVNAMVELGVDSFVESARARCCPG